MSNNSDVKIVAFCCNWCSYAGADLAGTSRLSYPHNVKIIKVPCSCRVDPIFVMRAFGKGADGVIVCGCHPGDCHYSTGNYHTRRRFALLFSQLEFMGIERERMRLEWISAAEARKFMLVMNDFTEKIMELGKNTRLVDWRNVSVDGIASQARNDGAGTSFGYVQEYVAIDDGHAGKMAEIEGLMKARAKELLVSGGADRVIGWKKGDFEVLPEPAAFYDTHEIEDMVYNRFCSPNLSKYLMDSPWLGDSKFEGKTAVFLRPCDSYGFERMVKEHVVERDKKHVIGVGCGGCVYVDEMQEIGLFEKCQTCTKTTHPDVDETIGKDLFERLAKDDTARFEMVDIISQLSSEEQYNYWSHQLSKCIRCNACRNACPVCNCKKCVFSGDKFDMATKANTTDFEGQMFHVTRAFHVENRCTDCGECSRVCPQGIPLHLLNRKYIKDAAEKGDDIWVPVPE